MTRLDIARLREVAERHKQATTWTSGWQHYPTTVLALLDRLARVEALAEEWEGQQSSGVKIHCGRALRAALAGEPEGSR